jgi:hypothetical protein
MQGYAKAIIAALTAALLLAVAVGTASARRLEISNQNLRIVWASLEFIAEGVATPVRCPVTIEGSFHSRTISKVSGQLIGYITAVEVVSTQCTSGRARANRETLPWHIRFLEFRGALPNITEITQQLVNASFNIEISAFPGLSCRYTTSAREPGIGTARRETTGQITGLVASGSIASSSGFPCPRGSFGGTGSVRLQGSTTTLIFIRLVQ